MVLLDHHHAGSASTLDCGRLPIQTSHVKRRNMVVQVILMIVTFGIYAIYWFHVTLNELYRASGNQAVGQQG